MYYVCDTVDDSTQYCFNVSEPGVTALEILDAIWFLLDFVSGITGTENGVDSVEEPLCGYQAHRQRTLAERDEIINVYIYVVYA